MCETILGNSFVVVILDDTEILQSVLYLENRIALGIALLWSPTSRRSRVGGMHYGWRFGFLFFPDSESLSCP